MLRIQYMYMIRESLVALLMLLLTSWITTAYCLLLTVLYYGVELFPAQTRNYPEGISDHDHIIPALHERCKIVLHKLPKQWQAPCSCSKHLLCEVTVIVLIMLTHNSFTQAQSWPVQKKFCINMLSICFIVFFHSCTIGKTLF